jgi:transcriptional regulator with XRE-family HTH domain
MPRGRPPDLDRRRLIARMRARGLTYRQIGERIGVSRQSVQQALRYSDSARLVPVRCRECTKVITRMRTVHTKNGLVHCLGCLPADAPFGQRLRAHRVAAKLSQAVLAAQIGVLPAMIHCWERSQTKPLSAHMRTLVTVFGRGICPGG